MIKCRFFIAGINVMHVDLNLLAALDALLDEGSVGRAADRLHLTQPAMSHALQRVRRATGDEILVRAGRQMVLTPYALEVREEVRGLVERAGAVLSPRRTLDLTSLRRTFTLRCHDAVTNALAPSLVAQGRRHAPAVRFRFLPERSDDTDGLRTTTDLEVGATTEAGPDVRTWTLRAGRLVGVLRRGHPVTGEIDPRAYATLDHVLVSRRGRMDDPVDAALEALGLARTVVATAPTSTAALHVVAGTDCTTAVEAEMCRADLEALDLVAFPLPVDVPALSLVLRWHQRHDRDPAHAWLRGVVAEVLADGRTDVPTRLEGAGFTSGN